MLIIYSCKNRTYEESDFYFNENNILVHEEIKIGDFVFYDELLLLDEYEYPKTIVFKSYREQDLIFAIDNYRKKIDYNECRSELEKEYINLEEFVSFYEMNENIQKSIKELNSPSENSTL